VNIDELKKLAGIDHNTNQTTGGIDITQMKDRIDQMNLLGVKPGDPKWFELFSGNSLGFRGRKK